MDTFLLQAHSGWRWIVLVLVVVTMVRTLIGWFSQNKWQKLDTNLLLFSRIAIYVQVILGVLPYVARQKWVDMQFTGEHVVVALLAVGGIEFAAARAKRASGPKMYRYAAIGFVIALVLIYVALQAVGGVFV